jgi:hypothetical protein
LVNQVVSLEVDSDELVVPVVIHASTINKTSAYQQRPESIEGRCAWEALPPQDFSIGGRDD